MGRCRTLRCDQLQDFPKREQPRLGLCCSKCDRSCQVTRREGFGQCSDDGAEGDRGVAMPTGVLGGWGVKGWYNSVGGGEGQEAGNVIVIVGTSALDKGGEGWRVMRGEEFQGDGRVWERLVGREVAVDWVAWLRN